MSSFPPSGAPTPDRSPQWLAAGLAVALGFLPGTSFAAGFQVELNQSRALHLSAPVATVIVGNPAIADVSVQSSKLIYILGRSYGQTNLIALDSDGKQITAMDLNVVATSSSAVTLNRGSSQLTYNCTPRCERTATPGDDKDEFDTALKQAVGATGMGQGAAISSGSGGQ